MMVLVGAGQPQHHDQSPLQEEAAAAPVMDMDAHVCVGSPLAPCTPPSTYVVGASAGAGGVILELFLKSVNV
jgi:hypothetical protein